MSSLVKQVLAAGLADRFLNDQQLGELLGGSDARRYGLVIRLLRLKTRETRSQVEKARIAV
jgi:hypothetical protein